MEVLDGKKRTWEHIIEGNFEEVFFEGCFFFVPFVPRVGHVGQQKKGDVFHEQIVGKSSK